ncbi:HAD family hydrolase [Streptomyces sp. NPDC012935]|uniref:HAD family hydrolase n=1 Tax=Streptomyces sp. NPDC012935 TaxID=3364857 RepID=UPI0036A8944D
MAQVTVDQADVRRLLAATRAVLFDFDGPVCRFFPESTQEVARQIKQAARQDWGTLDPGVEACDDSHQVLRPLWRIYERLCGRETPERPSRRPLDRAEEIIAEQESKAVAGAVPVPDIGELVKQLRELRVRLVVVSNNARGPILTYLGRVGLASEFEAVFGRDPHDARLMKPNPHCVRRALAHLSLPPAACLMVGDQPTDLIAARAAGTPFLGWTQDEVRAKEMAREGADAVVSSYRPVTAAARKLLEERRSPDSVSLRGASTQT